MQQIQLNGTYLTNQIATSIYKVEVLQDIIPKFRNTSWHFSELQIDPLYIQFNVINPKENTSNG